MNSQPIIRLNFTILTWETGERSNLIPMGLFCPNGAKVHDILESFKTRGRGKKRGLGPSSDALTTCNAINLRCSQRFLDNDKTGNLFPRNGSYGNRDYHAVESLVIKGFNSHNKKSKRSVFIRKFCHRRVVLRTQNF